MAPIESGVLIAAFEPVFMIPSLALIGALLVGALVIALFRRWQLGGESLDSQSSDQMSEYRELYEQGEISEEEYKRLRSILSGELRQGIGKSAPATSSTPPAEASQPGADSQQQPEPDPPAEAGIKRQ